MTVLDQRPAAPSADGTPRSLAPAPAGDPAAWGTRNAHDPTVVRDTDGTWYMFSTDAAAGADSVAAGVHVRRSTDLVDWTFVGTALEGVPAAAFEWSSAPGLWAPEVVRWHAPSAADAAGANATEQWHMYYSASTFGSNTSAIGLAVASTLAGPWEDRGIVVGTRAGTDTQNAIDAAVTVDRSGTPWLTYGSFFSGLYTLPLNPVTGLPETPGDHGTLIARRPVSVDRAIEGAYIVYRREEDRYVLFTSYDSLFDSYNVRAAVADEITGPYTDLLGNCLTDLEGAPERIGTKVLGSHRFGKDTGWLAPGHNSILVEPGLPGAPTGEPEYFMVHHVRFADDPHQHVVQLRRMFFTDTGWPVVSPQPFAGAVRERLAAPVSLAGPWNVVRLDQHSTALVDSLVTTVATASTESADAEDTLFGGQPARIRIVVAGDELGAASAGTELDAVVFGSWDWANARPALSFSGLAADGVAWFGTRGA
jgi:arabinan endo-1,5-alpha-L-arabinosidase